MKLGTFFLGNKKNGLSSSAFNKLENIFQKCIRKINTKEM